MWNEWTDPATGEVACSYTMLTMHCNSDPVLSQMHKPDLGLDKKPLPADQQDKRTIVSLELDQVERWLHGSRAEAASLIQLPAHDLYAHGPTDPAQSVQLALI